MSKFKKHTEKRLRFRINMLLAERDMTLKQLYDQVRKMGSDISSSHFYRQMKPYYSPIRMDLLTLVALALDADPAELFDMVEVEVDDETKTSRKVVKSPPAATPVDEKAESETAQKAREKARKKRDLALLGPKISVLPTDKK